MLRTFLWASFFMFFYSFLCLSTLSFMFFYYFLCLSTLSFVFLLFPLCLSTLSFVFLLFPLCLSTLSFVFLLFPLSFSTLSFVFLLFPLSFYFFLYAFLLLISRLSTPLFMPFLMLFTCFFMLSVTLFVFENLNFKPFQADFWIYHFISQNRFFLFWPAT